MSDAGAPPEAIAIAVEAIEELQSRESSRKATQAEKKRDYRKRVQGQSEDSPETVPGQSEDVARTDLQKEKSPQTPLKEKITPKEKTPKGVQKKRGTRLSEDWSLPDEFRQWAIDQGFPAAAIDAEADRFRDYWIAKSGANAAKADWLATWRNWIRNADQFGTIKRGAVMAQAPPESDLIRLLNHNEAARSSVIAKCKLWFCGGMREWRFTPAWSDDHPPGHPDCVIPPDIISEAERLAAMEKPRQATG